MSTEDFQEDSSIHNHTHENKENHRAVKTMHINNASVACKRDGRDYRD
jgi:hypothetical protein